MNWPWRRKPKHRAEPSAAASEWLIQFIEDCDRECRERQVVVLEELETAMPGTTQHMDLTYEAYVLGLQLENNRRANEMKTLNFLLTREEFDALYYGKD